MHSQEELVLMSDEDNIAIIKKQVAAGTKITLHAAKPENIIEVRQDIPFGFKIATADIRQGDRIYKYGEPIGIASTDIEKGEMVHIHNMEGFRARGDLKEPK